MKKYKQHSINFTRVKNKPTAEVALAETLQKYCIEDIYELVGSFRITTTQVPFSKWSVIYGKLTMTFYFRLMCDAYPVTVVEPSYITFGIDVILDKDGRLDGTIYHTFHEEQFLIFYSDSYKKIVNKIQDTFCLALKEIKDIQGYLFHLEKYLISTPDNMLSLARPHVYSAGSCGWNIRIEQREKEFLAKTKREALAFAGYYIIRGGFILPQDLERYNIEEKH